MIFCKNINKYEKPCECPVCYSEQEECNLIECNPCNHWICIKCIKQIEVQNQFKCPLCREKVDTKPIYEFLRKERQEEEKSLKELIEKANKKFDLICKKAKQLERSSTFLYNLPSIIKKI